MEISQNKTVSQNSENKIRNNVVLSMNKKLYEFRKTGLFCDFTIILPDKSSYAVHKIVLAAGCPYFETLFNFENPNKISETIPREISGKIFEKILEFIYTGETEIDLKDAPVLHENAIYFMLNTLKDIITTNYLIRNIQMDTCIIYWRGAGNIDTTLKEKCEEFIAENIEKFFDEYLYELTYEELSKILSLETLNCREEEIYLFLVSWVKSDYENRKNIFNDLLKKLRYISLSDNEKLNISFECSDIQDSLQALIKHFKKNLEIENSRNFAYKLAPRIGIRTQNLFAVSTSQIKKLDKNLNLNNLLDNKETVGFKINNFAENYLLISGGDNSKICKYYCPINNTMKTFPRLLESRSNHGIVTMNNIICAAGGCTSGRTTEQFDLCSGKWINGPELINARRNYDLTSYNNCIYAFGGGSNIIERLDLRENKWISINPSNNYDISDFTRTLIIDDSIYCISTNEINIFYIRQEKWISNNLLEVIRQPRNQFHLIGFEISYFNKNIYMATCGVQRCSRYYCLCKYNINNNVWSLQKNCDLGMQYSLAVLYQ